LPVTVLISRTPVNSLSESLMKELQSALTEQMRKPDHAAPELHSLLTRVAREAREKGIRPEQLLVSFKQVWNSLTDSMHARSADQYERIRQDLVTACIKAYYAE
jgi:hypothetical protein